MNNDKGFIDSYNSLNTAETQFLGILNKNAVNAGVADTLMRSSLYSLNGRNIYAPKDDLSYYAGKKVVIYGKLADFELEG